MRAEPGTRLVDVHRAARAMGARMFRTRTEDGLLLRVIAPSGYLWTSGGETKLGITVQMRSMVMRRAACKIMLRWMEEGMQTEEERQHSIGRLAMFCASFDE